MPKLSPIGLSDFKDIIESNRYYVDKTPMIRAIWEGAAVQLQCRPRRFGKTLNLSMLRYFFDCESEYKHLFEGLAVDQDEEIMDLHQGNYPVIYLSFKDVKAGDYTSAVLSIAQLLHKEWLRHDCLKGTKDYDERLADMHASIRSGKIRETLFHDAIEKLSDLLCKHFDAKSVILVDEYDSPLQNAWLNGHYEEMIEFVRPLLSGAFKDNSNLFKGVLTGILRVAKESLFSGLNNFVSSAGLEPDDCCDKFGFTEPEVAALLVYRGLNGREIEEVRAWYDGYRYGGVPIYNPWSIVQYAFAKQPSFKAHWVNTGGHDLLKQLFFAQEVNIKPILEVLMRGETLRASVNEHLTFGELEHDSAAVLSLLFFAGYLRAENEALEGYETFYDLSVPNREVMIAYHSTVSAWFKGDLAGTFGDPLLQALLSGNTPAFGEALGDFVLRVASYYDTAKNRTEHFYHAFLLGLIARLDRQYRIRSNSESGYGRYDICLLPRGSGKKGIVMEIKSPAPGRKETLDDCIAAAREQVLAKKYDTELKAAGVTEVLRLAIAVDGKKVVVEEV